VQRASAIEFNDRTQQWEVRLASQPGVVADSDPSRDVCLAWEIQHFNQ